MIYVFDDFELDAERLELRRGGRLLKGNRTVLMTLACLVRSAGQLVTKDELVDEVWDGRAVADTVITVATARLRKTLGQRRGDRQFVENVYGRGYRFVRPVTVRVPSTRPPPSMLADAGLEPTFVGRERELSRLRQARARARDGRGGLCALIGEAGIGKTAVVEAFERELRGSGAHLLWGYCSEHGEVPPLSPFRRVLRGVLELFEEGELERAVGAEASDVQGLLASPSGDGAVSVPGPRLFDAIVRVLRAAAERAPLVIVLDDLHRADAASLELAVQLVDELAQTRLLLLATLRPPADRRDAPRDAQLRYAIGHRNCERIGLDPLPAEQVASYVAQALGGDDQTLGRAVFDKSEGNPFYMIELTRALQDMATPAVDALRVPQAALELVHQRLSRLDAEGRRVLSAAAVVGRSVELPLLQLVTDSDPATLMANLDDALGAEVLVASPESATAFAFRHELLRLALYESLSPAERRKAHLKVASALEQRAELGEHVAASDLAFHFHRALPEGNPRKTVEYCRAAAREASRIFANADVVRYMRHALEALELLEQPSVRLRMSLLQGISLHARTTDPAEFSRAVREIIRLATEHGDGANLLMAAAMCNPAPGLLPEPQSERAHAAALSLLPAEQPALRAMALAGLALAAPHCYDAATVDSYLNEALALLEGVKLPNIRHGVRLCQLYVRGGPSHADEARAALEELRALSRTYPAAMPVLPGELAYGSAISAAQRGEPERVARALERAIACYREIGQREGLWHAERAQLLQCGEGEASDTAAALLALHERAERQSLTRTLPFRAFDRAVVLPALGHGTEHDTTLCAQLAYERSDPPGIWAMKLAALVAAGWHDEARASLSAVPVAGLARLPDDRDRLGTLGHLSRAALALGDADRMAALYTLLQPHADRVCVHVAFWSEGPVAHLLGLLAGGLGRRDPAQAHLRAGIEVAERAQLSRAAAEARAQLGASSPTR